MGAAVLRGRVSAQQLRAAADLADRFADGHLRTTNMQNLIIVNVPAANTQRARGWTERGGLVVNASPFWRGAIACTGV